MPPAQQSRRSPRAARPRERTFGRSWFPRCPGHPAEALSWQRTAMMIADRDCASGRLAMERPGQLRGRVPGLRRNRLPPPGSADDGARRPMFRLMVNRGPVRPVSGAGPGAGEDVESPHRLLAAGDARTGAGAGARNEGLAQEKWDQAAGPLSPAPGRVARTGSPLWTLALLLVVDSRRLSSWPSLDTRRWKPIRHLFATPGQPIRHTRRCSPPIRHTRRWPPPICLHAHGARRRRGGDWRTRIAQGAGQARGAETLLSARGSWPGSAPRRASANPGGAAEAGPGCRVWPLGRNSEKLGCCFPQL